MIARIEYPNLDASPYLDQLDTIGREAKRRIAQASASAVDAPPRVDPDAYARIMALNDYLFGELRFVGNDVQYEDPRNSFLNEVIDRRTGIPITLALIYIEVARRAGMAVEGVNFPGHFLVRCPAETRAVRRGPDHRRPSRRRVAVRGCLPDDVPAPFAADATTILPPMRGFLHAPPSRRS